MNLPSLATSPHRRAILASALLGAIVLLIVGVALLARLALDERAAGLEERRAELQVLASRLKARGPGLARAERTLSADPFLPGATPALAANGLQTRIVALAESCGVTLRTIGAEPATDTEPDGLPRVILQASAATRVAGLQRLLYRNETEAPFVLVDEVALRMAQTTTDDGAGPSLDPELEVDLRLVGFPRRKER